MGRPPERELAGRVEQNGRGEHYHDQREGKRIAADILDAMKNLNRGHAGEIKHQRNAQFGERPDENNRPTREDAGHDERESDFAKLPKARASEVFGSLLHRGIYISERRKDIEIKNRVEIESDQHHHAPNPPLAQPINRRGWVQNPEFRKQGIQRPLLTEDLLHPDCSHKRRHDHWNQHQSAKERLSGKNKPVADPSQRHRNQAGKQGAEDTDPKGIPEPLEVEWIPENLGDVVEREPPVSSHKSSPHRLRDRPQEEQGEKNSSQGEDDFGELVGHYFPSLARRAASWYWARKWSDSSLASRTSSIRFLESSATFNRVRAIS